MDVERHLLGQGTFTNETASGWQTLNFSNPVPVTAGTTYVAGYYAPNGQYAADAELLRQRGQQLAAARPGASGHGGNGVYTYGDNVFPVHTYAATNYWVDPIFSTSQTTNTPPAVTGVSPLSGQTGVATASTPTFTFNEGVQPSSISFTLKTSGGTSVPGTLSYNSTSQPMTFTPSAALANSTSYTATVTAATGTNDNGMSSPYSWSFSTASSAMACPCTIWPSSTTPRSRRRMTPTRSSWA